MHERLHSIEGRLDGMQTQIQGVEAQIKSLVAVVTEMGEKLEARPAEPDG